MLETHYNGYRISTDGQCINISLDSDLIISYHPMHGEQVLGYRSPIVVVEAREALNHAKNLMESV